MVDGTKLRQWRRQRALTLRDLSERSTVAYATIHAIESGRQEPRPSTIRKLAEALDIEPEDLMVEVLQAGKAAA